MAITRTQIAKQLLAQGGRIGFQGGGKDMGQEKGTETGREGRDNREIGARQSRTQAMARANQRALAALGDPDPEVDVPTKDRQYTNNLSFTEKFKINSLKNLYDQKFGLKKATPSLIGILNTFTPSLNVYGKSDPNLDDYGMTGEDLTDTDRLADAINTAEATGDITQSDFENAFFGPDGPPKSPRDGDGLRDPCKGPNPPAYCFVGIRSAEAATPVEEDDDEIINYRLMAGGGMADETVGGIMDFESSRQMYGLGKLVKKVTRSVKKIAKSPIGKAAILAAGGYALGGGFAAGGFKKATLLSRLGLGSFDGYQRTFTKNALGKFLTNKATLGIGVPAIASYFMTPEEEEEQKLLAKGADIDDPSTIINNPYAYINPRLMAEGGSTEEKEPVAKKVMPLLDMDGKEKDYRETGGFVDMGRMEKADDVPARLSKNEFVFTADAVRNAGDGSVDKGAEVMYNMMKNLESGGDVSEESQGLDGARKMFQTSQRLEEVL
jgi:hypothetical protein